MLPSEEEMSESLSLSLQPLPQRRRRCKPQRSSSPTITHAALDFMLRSLRDDPAPTSCKLRDLWILMVMQTMTTFVDKPTAVQVAAEKVAKATAAEKAAAAKAVRKGGCREAGTEKAAAEKAAAEQAAVEKAAAVKSAAEKTVTEKATAGLLQSGQLLEKLEQRRSQHRRLLQ